MAKTETKASKETFPLPSSSFDELSTIVQAYGRKGDNVSLTELSRFTGINETTVSRNNGFLTAAGLVKGGNAKSATELGRRLGLALEHDQIEDVHACVMDLIQGVPFLADVISPVRMRKGNTEDELVGHILYAAGASKDGRKSAGAHAIVQLFLKAGLLIDDNGTLRVQQGQPQPVPPTPDNGQAPPTEPAAQPATVAQPVASMPLTSATATAGPFAIAINIQLELPASTDPAVYENLFKALKKHLLSGNE